MNLTLPYTLLVVIVCLTLITVPVFVVFRIFRWSTKNRKSPLNINLLRSPGHSIREQLDEISIDIISNLLIVPVICLVLYSVFLTQLVFDKENPSVLVAAIYLISGIGICIYIIVKIYRQFKQRNVLRLGYECEQAVGQDLNELLRHGFNVFNDFPADGFNIDHIALGPTGVFAIETKGKSKQVNAEKENWKVSFDGETLQFPTWSEQESIAQARRQAVWLSKWIENSTGSPQGVFPVLAIPGWFITRTKSSDFRIYNGKGSTFMAKGHVLLSKERIQAISHQIECKCRDIKAISYKKN